MAVPGLHDFLALIAGRSDAEVEHALAVVRAAAHHIDLQKEHAMVIPKPSVGVHDDSGCGVCGSTKSHTHDNWTWESVLIRGNQATRKAETARRIEREKKGR